MSGPAPSPGGGEEGVEGGVQRVPGLQQEDVLWKRPQQQQAHHDAFRDHRTSQNILDCEGEGPSERRWGVGRVVTQVVEVSVQTSRTSR